MTIFDTLFRKNPQPAAQQPQGQQQQPTQQQHINNNPTVPNQNNQAPNQQANNPANGGQNPASPNEKFKDLWSNTNQPANADQPNFKFNPEQLNKLSSEMNFAKNIKQEDLQAITQGGEGAVAALANVLNSFGREVFSANAQLTSSMAEAGYQQTTQAIGKQLPEHIRKNISTQQLLQDNPKLRDPSLQPLVEALQFQFSRQHPNATPTEINGLVTEYLGGTVAGAFAKAPEQQQNQAGGQNKVADFSSFLQS